ncbi:DNA mismatch repair protein MutS [bacterium]|nr:DNA mismatch repair protein MutS [bacterium]
MNKITPLMQQYQRIKKNYPGAILFFRLGDFYEMFGEDAQVASRLLEITLTSRHKIPMCGVPHHSATNYIARLIKQGQKVAVCEQMESPGAGKGIVKREVVRLITPGTIVEDHLLSKENNNFLSAIYIDPKIFEGVKISDLNANSKIGLSFTDISTGEFLTTQIGGKHILDKLSNEISRFQPAECILPCFMKEKKDFLDFLGRWNISINFIEDWRYEKASIYQKLTNQFKVASLKGFNLEDKEEAIFSSGAIVAYLGDTQKTFLAHINHLQWYSTENFMVLDKSTQDNLELVTGLSTKTRKNSLLEVLDYTLTPMGTRTLRRWILEPLLDIEKIQARQKANAEFFLDTVLRKNLQDELKKISDLERLISRLNCGTANARDLVALKNSLKVIPLIKEKMDKVHCNFLRNLTKQLSDLKEVYGLIEKSIVDEPPVSLREGGLIKKEYHSELDQINLARSESKGWILNLEKKEKKRTGINSLKIGYTGVFGYYIEITRANLANVPENYIRKQTLTNAERFITPELKEQESFILGAEEKIFNLEYEVFQKIKEKVIRKTTAIQEVSLTVATLDAILSLSEAAVINNYSRPEVTNDYRFVIRDGRHPVVEKSLVGMGFIPNDIQIDGNENQILIITGPNMAGKSTYLRQVALITLMAQIGSFIPAREGEIGIVDRIFTRIGAADNLAEGESTFMVEMNETANILNNATSRSLLILDEVGRGTSTFDGVSIAWASVEYLHSKKDKDTNQGPRTLFATHYFELTELARILKGVKNYNIAVREWNDEIIFLRKIIEGSADKSYGIHVAKLAGLPASVTNRAKDILVELEKNVYKEGNVLRLNTDTEDSNNKQLNLFTQQQNLLMEEIKQLPIDGLTPLEALNKLQELKKRTLKFKKESENNA